MPGDVGALLAALGRHPQLDRQAVLAVARQEGLGGGIGDNGTSFGPFQLHRGGALPASVPLGGAQSWAWSPAGLDYALSRIAQVAGGMRGPAAVRAIVSRFERPADPAGEIARALAGLGAPAAGSPPAATAPRMAAASAPRAASGVDPVLLAMFANNAATIGVPSLAPLLAFMASPPSAPGDPVAPATPARRPAPIAGAPAGGIAELLHEGLGGPTHSTGEHIHAAFSDPRSELWAINRARQLGLTLRENPYVGDTVDPVHAQHSYHYAQFPGLYNGRKLGRAFDASGSEASMAQLYKELAQLRR